MTPQARTRVCRVVGQCNPNEKEGSVYLCFKTVCISEVNALQNPLKIDMTPMMSPVPSHGFIAYYRTDMQMSRGGLQ
jgi:hypothetical protein